ncbi:MAG: hypothetical protein H0X30_02675 [Anaerolineae bacterium]|nr:hypothetical protein [Anaerolineae bacterium]
MTEPSLSIVMHSAGFNDTQLSELRVRATMHVDDVSPDFVPNLDVLEAHDHEHAEPAAAESHVYNIPIEVVPAPVEVTASIEVEEVALPVEAELVSEPEDLPEAELEPETLEDDAPVEPEVETEDPDEPQQLSLF